MDTEEQFFLTERARLRQWLPWLHLFRGFRIAFGGRPILLGIAAVLLIDAGHQLIAMLPFSTIEGTPTTQWSRMFDEPVRQSLAVNLGLLSAHPVRAIDGAASHGAEIVRPLWTIVSPARHLFVRGHSWSQIATAWSGVLWALIVWSLFGVALARMAAFSFAADSSMRLRDALRFSGGKLASSLGAPLLPLVAILLLWLICLVFGLVGRIPSAGPTIVGVLWWLPLLLAGMMAFVLLVVAAGWPLMLASIGTEDADAFDAFSRVYSYLFNRPWYTLWMGIVALLYGSLLLAFLATVIDVLVPLAEWAVASGMGAERTRELLPGEGDSMGFATAAVHFWLRVLGLLLVGFLTSYFWTATTIIYFLLRESVDSTPLNAVQVREATTTQGSDEMPLVGMAAAQQREKSE